MVINNKITIDEWETFFRELYMGTSDDSEPMLAVREVIPLSKEDIEKELRSLKNRKSPGPDGILNEIWWHRTDSPSDAGIPTNF